MLNVLIVEDEPSYIEALQITLEPEGFAILGPSCPNYPRGRAV